MKKTFYVLATINGAFVVLAVWSAIHYEAVGFLRYQWWFWFVQEFSITALVVLGFVTLSLKLAAILDPRVPSDEIISLLKEYFGSAGEFPQPDHTMRLKK